MFAVHLREPLPAAIKPLHVHRTVGSQPLRTPRHGIVLQVHPEETQLRESIFIGNCAFFDVKRFRSS